MEYVVVRATHPTWLTLQLPTEVADLLGYAPKSEEGGPASRSISFLARGPGIVRVVATYPAREALAVETVRNRLIATARPGDRLLFTLPSTVAQHLGLQVYSRGARVRGTDDSLIWFLPAPEYYEFRTVVGSEKRWTGPSSGLFAHVYLAKSLVPLPKELAHLAEVDYRIEEEEWRPGVAALQKVGRSRRVVL
jgi:hypothetical protein